MRPLILALTLMLPALGFAEDATEIERRIITYVKENLEPGKPLVVSKLYNEVFTTPEERKVLDKLNRAFFRVPMLIVEHRMTQDRLPTLDEIAGQFDFYGPEAADVVLSIMESDPRVPKFIRRDPDTGEIAEIDIEVVKADKRFNQLVERTITGWEGKPAPAVSGVGFDGQEHDLAALRGKTVMLYIWFTNCPPCVKISPELADLHRSLQDRGFMVLGVNADKVLGLPYDDEARADYVEKHQMTFPNLHMTEEVRAELGNVNIFPTLYLINREGTIAKYYVNYQPQDVLAKDIEALMSGSPSTSSR